jgi:hypothetical protein
MQSSLFVPQLPLKGWEGARIHMVLAVSNVHCVNCAAVNFGMSLYYIFATFFTSSMCTPAEHFVSLMHLNG